MQRVPVARQRDGQQRRRDDQQSCGFEGVHVMAGMVLRARLVLDGGDHAHIVALDRFNRNQGNSFPKSPSTTTETQSHKENQPNFFSVSL